ncbi:MAG: hypothetical protein ACRD5E_13955 [Nitrososphaeraceae archaeon]
MTAEVFFEISVASVHIFTNRSSPSGFTMKVIMRTTPPLTTSAFNCVPNITFSGVLDVTVRNRCQELENKRLDLMP